MLVKLSIIIAATFSIWWGIRYFVHREVTRILGRRP